MPARRGIWSSLHRVLRPCRSSAGAVYELLFGLYPDLGQISNGHAQVVRLRTIGCPAGQEPESEHRLNALWEGCFQHEVSIYDRSRGREHPIVRFVTIAGVCNHRKKFVGIPKWPYENSEGRDEVVVPKSSPEILNLLKQELVFLGRVWASLALETGFNLPGFALLPERFSSGNVPLPLHRVEPGGESRFTA